MDLLRLGFGAERMDRVKKRENVRMRQGIEKEVVLIAKNGCVRVF